MDKKTTDNPNVKSEPDVYEVPKDPAERRAWIEECMRKSHERYIQALREHDKAMRELENKKGILERLFGFRTSV